MRRIKLTLEYDGTRFAGFQRQAKGERTVQAELESALAQIPGAVPKVVAAGRTDAGVHALGMVVHYDTEDRIPPEKIPYALNRLLPPDVRALAAEAAPPGFHARYSCHWRRYRYRILNRQMPSALARERTWWVPKPLDANAMQQGLAHFLGEHDFKAFATQERRGTVRTLYRARLERCGEEIVIDLVGNGFLRGQVRAMVGTLVEVGLGKRDPDVIAWLLAHGERKDAGPSAPPQGLYFVAAGYAPWNGS
ncbi:tRNA pseudouridine(38-40) synthase TruA [Marinithermus hydrothermalis]|uniref:tRNA pseudouridine synthase A n=1 Tax=Marinithermus hydrothermalis (strain DSM 14884 / JCM 11576 / T1) TaxID=869210 RepID=F2NMT9_MARHT|nr:tRNA pseudouridine(38-40) synthase TruA [Marinithermus hydrothermalis]AEB12473.1 tRNA pseudouridine synthase A [Marinithermus hydrothermalis DSM 14884]